MQHIMLTVDLGFGDAGKGSIVDYLTRLHGAHTVVRYNGGAQAAHRVVEGGANPREHVFSQFGSGTFAGAATHLSRFMLVDPPAMLTEAEHLLQLGLAETLAQTTIDRGALVITPFGRAINRLRELARGSGRHGSCGIGIGETVSDHLHFGAQVLFVGDLGNQRTVTRKLAFLRTVALAKLKELRPHLPDSAATQDEVDLLSDPHTLDWLGDVYTNFARRVQIVSGGYLSQILRRPGTVIFEGAQGALLDEWYGFHPYTTWSTTTLANADQLLAEAGYHGSTTRIGITRAYTTRHGAGPLPSEDAALTRALPDARNHDHPWQQGFRVGWLDLMLLSYARAIVGPLDELALTCVDRLAALPELQVCTHYRCDGETIRQLPPAPQPSLDYQARLTDLLVRCRPMLEAVASPEGLAARIAAVAGAPVRIVSTGPTAADKRLVQPEPHAHRLQTG